MALTALEIKNAKEGLLSDGNGLYLQITKSGAKSWIFRYQRDGRRRDMGIGSLSTLSAIDARAEVPKLRKQLKDGIDPIEHRKELEAIREAESKQTSQTFMGVALEYIEANRAGWKNEKHAQQWENTLATYADPVFKNTPICDIDTDLVLRVLTPIWASKNETASRVRSRIELVLAYAKAKKLRSGENPALWRGHLDSVLPKPAKVKKVRHHPALPFDQAAAFMEELRCRSGVGARALEFAILTAARSNEVRSATWSEFDLENKKVWTIAAERMKAQRDHRVPLSQAAIDLLDSLPRYAGTNLLFPGDRSENVLSDMALAQVIRRMNNDRIDNGKAVWSDAKSGDHVVPHGFRSTFRDWAAEVTTYPNEMVEMALAHVVGDKVEAAYRRGDMFEKRRQLMDDWARFCLGSAKGNVLPIKKKAVLRSKFI
jgi:integrase